MPRTGRPPTPTERKRRLGNPGKRRLPPDNVVSIGPAAVVITGGPPTDGVDLITRLLDSPAATWIGEPDRLAALELLRTGWDRRAALLRDLETHGETYRSEGMSGVRYYRRPEALELESLEKRITTWLSLLGLTPADRSRLGVAEVRAKNRLEELQARRSNRLGQDRAG